MMGVAWRKSEITSAAAIFTAAPFTVQFRSTGVGSVAPPVPALPPPVPAAPPMLLPAAPLAPLAPPAPLVAAPPAPAELPPPAPPEPPHAPLWQTPLHSVSPF